VYTQGSCFRFALILKTVYPDGDIHWNQDHATFCLDGHFYDITGDVAPEGRGEKIEDWGIREIEKVLKLRYGESEKV
jgi:hypothetical protein